MAAYNWSENHKRQELRRFWSNPDQWPAEAPDHIFAANALDQLGRLRFGAEWPQRIEEVGGSVHFDAVAADIRKLCAFGHLTTYLQHYNGSFEGEAIPREAWNTSDYRDWFRDRFRAPATVMRRDRHQLAEIPTCWIFVGRKELELMLAVEGDGTAFPTSEERTDLVLNGTQVATTPAPPKQRRNRRPQSQDVVRPYLERRWPDGAPPRSEITDAEFVKIIGDLMEVDKKPVPSKETVLRTAGRLTMPKKK